MGTIPKTCWTLQSVPQAPGHKENSPRSTRSLSILQGEKSHDRKQSGHDGQTRLVFQRKTKTTKILQRHECTEPNCRSKRMLAIKRYMHSELGGRKRKIQSDSVLSFLLCFITKIIKFWDYGHLKNSRLKKKNSRSGNSIAMMLISWFW